MSTITLAEAKAHLKASAITPVEKPKQPVKSLAEFRKSTPRWRKSSATLLREVRDEGL